MYFMQKWPTQWQHTHACFVAVPVRVQPPSSDKHRGFKFHPTFQQLFQILYSLVPIVNVMTSWVICHSNGAVQVYSFCFSQTIKRHNKTYTCQLWYISWHVTVYQRLFIHPVWLAAKNCPQHAVSWNLTKTLEHVYVGFQTEERETASNSGSEKYPLDLKNNSANQSIQTLSSYRNFQVSTTNLLFTCLHVGAQLPLSFCCSSTLGCLSLLIMPYHWSVL